MTLLTEDHTLPFMHFWLAKCFYLAVTWCSSLRALGLAKWLVRGWVRVVLVHFVCVGSIVSVGFLTWTLDSVVVARAVDARLRVAAWAALRRRRLLRGIRTQGFYVLAGVGASGRAGQWAGWGFAGLGTHDGEWAGEQ